MESAAGHANEFICCVTLTKLFTSKDECDLSDHHMMRRTRQVCITITSIQCMRGQLCYKLKNAFEALFFCCIYYCIFILWKKSISRSIKIEADKSCTLWTIKFHYLQKPLLSIYMGFRLHFGILEVKSWVVLF